jgi:hypothetical protein
MRKFLLSVVALLALGGVALATGEDVSNYSAQGGADWEVGGTLNVQERRHLTADVCLLPVAGHARQRPGEQPVHLRRPPGGEGRGDPGAREHRGRQRRHLAVARSPRASRSARRVALQSGTFNLNTASNTSVAGDAHRHSDPGDRRRAGLPGDGPIGSVAGVVTVCLGPQ